MATEKYRKELHLSDPVVQPPFDENFDEQFESVLKLKPTALSFVFGLLNGFPVSIWYVNQQTNVLELQYTFNSEQEIKDFKQNLGS